jgi:hypothetical protein
MKADSFGSRLARTLTTLSIPQGYTLSVAGTFGVATHRYRTFVFGDALGFVAGAVAAFVILGVVSNRHLTAPADLPRATRATFNVVPLASMLAGSAVAYAIPWAAVGFPAAGLVAVGGYVLMVTAFHELIARTTVPEPTAVIGRRGVTIPPDRDG